jgi:citrate lyase beta subunit
VSGTDQVGAMVTLCEKLERAYGLRAGFLRFEIQVELPAAVLAADGTATVARLITRADGRCSGLHYGTYDYSAAAGVAAAYQAMDHPVADYAKAVMQAAAAQTGVRLSDGSTNILPVGDRAQIRAAWELHYRLVRRSLERGFYQGWDLHPAQLPTRYAATYAFFRDGRDAAVERLHRYLARQESGIADEPATARALAAYLLRGLDCGALSDAGLPRSDLLALL